MNFFGELQFGPGVYKDKKLLFCLRTRKLLQCFAISAIKQFTMNNKTWCGLHSIDDLSINLPLDCKIKDSPNFQCFHVYLQTTDTERKTGGST